MKTRLNAAKFNNSGAQRFRLENGDVVYDLTNGKNYTWYS